METTNREDAVEKLGSLIKGIKFAMLTTQGADGSLFSRPMVTQEADFDGTLWFFTDDGSPKIQELNDHKRVNVSYVSGSRYISVSGVAQVVHDRVREKSLWKPFYKTWFPKGLEDPHLALIRVDVESAEFWESPTSPIRYILGFAKAVLGERAAMGTNQKIHVGTFH
jgi:general stress protein 26